MTSVNKLEWVQSVYKWGEIECKEAKKQTLWAKFVCCKKKKKQDLGFNKERKKSETAKERKEDEESDRRIEEGENILGQDWAHEMNIKLTVSWTQNNLQSLFMTSLPFASSLPSSFFHSKFSSKRQKFKNLFTKFSQVFCRAARCRCSSLTENLHLRTSSGLETRTENFAAEKFPLWQKSIWGRISTLPSATEDRVSAHSETGSPRPFRAQI